MAVTNSNPHMHLLSAPTPAPSMGSQLTIGMLLVAVTAAVYAQVSQFDFVSCWDDQLYVTENVRVQNGLTFDNIKWAFRTLAACNYSPLTWLSLMLDWTIFKDWAGGYHLTNVVLHAVNVLLVYSFLSKATGHAFRSAFVAALFAIHPLHVESVAWISERKDVLSMLFGLLSLCAYVRYARHRRAFPYAAALVFFALSLLAKATLVTLPFVLVLLDFWPLERLTSRGVVRIVLEKLPFLAMSAAGCVVTVVAQSNSGTMHSLSEISLGARLSNAALAYSLYLKRGLLPLDLASLYPHPGNQIDIWDVGTAVACLLAITLMAVATAVHRRFVLVGWLWFLGGLVPMIGLVQVGDQQMADRYAYFPMLGVYMAIAWLAPTLVRRPSIRRRLLPAAATGIVLVYAGLAYVQVGYWRDGETLWRHTLAVTKNNAFATRLLGDARFLESRFDEAIALYKRAVEIAPHDAKYPARLASAYRSLGRLDEAVQQFRNAIALNEFDHGLHIALGAAFIAQGRYAEAQRELKRALQLDDADPWAYVHLASLYRMVRDYPTSFACCRRALQLDDDLLICHRLIALNLRDQGRPVEAERWLQSSVGISPIDPETRQLLAELSASNAVHAYAGE